MLPPKWLAVMSMRYNAAAASLLHAGAQKIRERCVFAGFANVCSGQCRKMWAKTSVQPPFDALKGRIY